MKKLSYKKNSESNESTLRNLKSDVIDYSDRFKLEGKKKVLFSSLVQTNGSLQMCRLWSKERFSSLRQNNGHIREYNGRVHELKHQVEIVKEKRRLYVYNLITSITRKHNY